jgi:hypothetical protein
MRYSKDVTNKKYLEVERENDVHKTHAWDRCHKLNMWRYLIHELDQQTRIRLLYNLPCNLCNCKVQSALWTYGL